MNDFGPVEILAGLIKSMNWDAKRQLQEKKQELSMNQRPQGCFSLSASYVLTRFASTVQLRVAIQLTQ